MCATECSARCHARRDGRAMWVACNRARFHATRPRVFCELKNMKIVILIYQIIQEKFAYGKLFMLVMIGYIFIIKMVKKMQNSGLEIVGGLTPPLKPSWLKDKTIRSMAIHLVLNRRKFYYNCSENVKLFFNTKK